MESRAEREQAQQRVSWLNSKVGTIQEGGCIYRKLTERRNSLGAAQGSYLYKYTPVPKTKITLPSFRNLDL